MHLIQATIFDKKIIKGLRRGEDVHSPNVKSLVEKLIFHSMENKKIKDSILDFDIKLNTNELVEIYISALEAIMPEPLILHGAPLLSPTLFFIDEDHFQENFKFYLTNEVKKNETREETLQRVKTNFINDVIELHNEARNMGRGLAMKEVDDYLGGDLQKTYFPKTKNMSYSHQQTLGIKIIATLFLLLIGTVVLIIVLSILKIL